MAAKKWRSRKASGVQREELVENTTRPWRSTKVTAPQRDNILQIATTLARTSGYALPEIMSGLLQASQAGVNLDEILSESPGHLEESPSGPTASLEENTVELETPRQVSFRTEFEEGEEPEWLAEAHRNQVEGFRDDLSEEPAGIIDAFRRGSETVDAQEPAGLIDEFIPDDPTRSRRSTINRVFVRAKLYRARRNLTRLRVGKGKAYSTYSCAGCEKKLYNLSYSSDVNSKGVFQHFFECLIDHECEEQPAESVRVIRFKSK